VIEEISLRPIAAVVGGRDKPTDDRWGDVVAEIHLASWVPSGVLHGLEEFSHVEVIYLFDRVDPEAAPLAKRRPRNRQDLEEVGALAQRHKDRWNRLGLSRATLIEVRDRSLVVQGLDAIAGTPILDLKPWFSAFGPIGEVVEPPWVSTITEGYFSA
jgi:tRNA (Thr-GGU) A37 N-methylase